MSRAGIFIGVDKTGHLTKLSDASEGAKRMHNWALQQGMSKRNAKLITDAGGKVVNPDRIFKEIEKIVDGPGVDQLIVYYAGHGVIINNQEHWLLTEAPEKPYAAVNVSTSVDIARYCGIPHVVFIADACRVAAEGLQNQIVNGVSIFPNKSASDKAKPIDEFYACARGKTAAELRPLLEPTTAAMNYKAVYTEVLLEALSGQPTKDFDPSKWFEPSGDATDSAYLLRPDRLQSWLETEVPRRVKKWGLEKKVIQNPDHIPIEGWSKGWLSRIDAPAISIAGGARETPPAPPPETVYTVARKLVRSAAKGDKKFLDEQLQSANSGRVDGAKQLAGETRRIATPFGPTHFETQCGIKVRGARIVDFFAPRAPVEMLGTEGNILRIKELDHPAVSVLLRFTGNVGTVIPVLPGFIAALTFEEAELVDVAYEPSENNWRWDMYKDRAEEVRALRAVAASSSQYGRFRLDQDDAFRIAQKMQYAKGIDPTLSVYAAYAYYDLQAIERIREMSRYLRDDVGTTFFDLALLGRTLIDRPVGPNDGILPFFPLLSQGWALLQAQRVKLHPALEGIESTMRESLWSLFDTTGLDKLAQAMQTKEVR